MAFVVAPVTLGMILIVLVVAAVQATLQQVRRKYSKQQQSEKRRPNNINNNNDYSSVKGSDDLEIAQPLPAPGPTPLPIIGNIHNLAKYAECPYEGFSALGRQYGSVYRMSLGGTPTVVVGDFKGIKEVLISKANSFDARPNILRFGLYFGGDRDHSLALCDYTELHKKRITLVRNYLTFRGPEASFLDLFEENIYSEMPTLTDKLDMQLNVPIKAKEILSYCAMNIFTGYMCSKKFDYQDESFMDLVKNFDFIFDDINTGHVTDSLPWMAPLFKSYINTIKNTTCDIRNFILDHIFQEKYQDFQENPNQVSDLTDACFAILHKEDRDENWDWNTILYIVEDLLGGSAAISNIVMRFLGFTLQHPEVVEKIREEIDTNIGRNQTPTLQDRPNMTYSQAVLYEVLRSTSSPIVPHVATEDATIGGYYVEKGSTIILNNYEMNTSPDLWDQPEKFMPERFIVNNKLQKPAHFIPFSTGKRSCVGYKVVMDIAFIVTTTLFQRYDLSLLKGVTPDLPKGKISLSWDSFDIMFKLRE